MSQPRCISTTKQGNPCSRPAAVGFDKCTSHLGKVGHPSTLTPDVADTIVRSLQAGNYVVTALKAAGVPRATYQLWMGRGRSTKAIDTPYRELRERVEKARAEGEARNVAQIAKAAATNWQAAAWLLERMAPERWGKVSVRLRDSETKQTAAESQPKPGDPFAEVDELAQRRRRTP